VNAEPVTSAELEPRGSGPRVARLFQRLLGLVAVAAWVSLGSQVLVLIGERGLLPARELFAQARDAGAGFLELPSLFWLGASDAGLLAGVMLGGLLGALAACGQRPRLCFALSAPLYLSYATAGDAFLAFQWDNLLVESCVLAACLPTDRRSRAAHFALRVLLFKLYFESGIAKWQSPLGDWQDGSALTYYFETAPLPTWLGWYAHQLPAWLLGAAGWATLVLELIVPFCVFGSSGARRVAFVSFGGFQLINTLTANYGFFTYLATALHVFLLDDTDLVRLGTWLRARLPAWWSEGAPDASAASARQLPRGLVHSALGAYLLLSGTGAALHFSGDRDVQEAAAMLYGPLQELRVVNVYHLFAQITRERIEPEVQARVGERWLALHLGFKPGAPWRVPAIVAPHQPRVDFRLWFYGLAWQRGMPRYVRTLLERVCTDPDAVAELFQAPLPAAPDSVRMVFRRYAMTSLDERRREGMYWRTAQIGALPALPCPAPTAAPEI
jgi:hypothetical protein